MARSPDEPPPSADPLVEVLDALDRLAIPHQLGGSYASSIHGLPRQTRDADLVVDLDMAQVRPLANLLRATFYLDDERMRSAVARRSSVNLIHLATGFKIDLFVKGREPFDDSELARSRLAEVPGGHGRQAPVKSAEDTILRKLAWFAAGGGTSERQWLDVLGILKVQGDALDDDYLVEWADELGVRELLEKARRQS
jgi:hypothetical protein